MSPPLQNGLYFFEKQRLNTGLLYHLICFTRIFLYISFLFQSSQLTDLSLVPVTHDLYLTARAHRVVCRVAGLVDMEG